MTRDKQLKDRLLSHIRDAHAMETNVQMMLTAMITSTSDPRIKSRLQRHLEETKAHADRLSRRLDQLGSGGSLTKEGAALLGAMPKGLFDQVRGEKPAKNARDGFVTEAFEIAAYELLERLAVRAGDERTASVARRNRADEEAMRRYFARSWDRVLDLSLEADGIAA